MLLIPAAINFFSAAGPSPAIKVSDWSLESVSLDSRAVSGSDFVSLV